MCDILQFSWSKTSELRAFSWSTQKPKQKKVPWRKKQMKTVLQNHNINQNGTKYRDSMESGDRPEGHCKENLMKSLILWCFVSSSRHIHHDIMSDLYNISGGSVERNYIFSTDMICLQHDGQRLQGAAYPAFYLPPYMSDYCSCLTLSSPRRLAVTGSFNPPLFTSDGKQIGHRQSGCSWTEWLTRAIICNKGRDEMLTSPWGWTPSFQGP